MWSNCSSMFNQYFDVTIMASLIEYFKLGFPRSLIKEGSVQNIYTLYTGITSYDTCSNSLTLLQPVTDIWPCASWMPALCWALAAFLCLALYSYLMDRVCMMVLLGTRLNQSWALAVFFVISIVKSEIVCIFLSS